MRLLISDVDGTITRSDLLGHVLPAMGVDWSHAGITELFCNIVGNGYQVRARAAPPAGALAAAQLPRSWREPHAAPGAAASQLLAPAAHGCPAARA